APASATAQTVPFSRTIDVTGVTDDGFGFLGTFELTDFFFDGFDILVSGDMSGTIDRVGPVNSQFVSIPVSVILDQQFCDLMTLAVGPATVDLAGRVNLDRVNLTLDALAAPAAVDSTQLGDLLCSISTLLPDELTGVSAILNEVLFIFP
ncbi:MAG: hypothetical protein AAGU11_11400, partial [Syntrophobacteraceae bacterium]